MSTVWVDVPKEGGEVGETVKGLVTVTPSKATCRNKDQTVVFQLNKSSDRMVDISVDQSKFVVLCVSGAVNIFDFQRVEGRHHP
jgi:hypothetical protein